MRRALLLGLGLWLALVSICAVSLLVPAGGSPASTGASALTLMAASASKEGQGDLVCGPVGPAGEGATVAAMAARRAGFAGADLVVAVAVAGAESGWVPDATNANTNGSTDFGLWQINSVHATILAGGDWRDPYDNARMAYRVWAEAGRAWTPWVTYNTGAYRSHLPTARNAAAGGAVAAVQPCTGTTVHGGPVGGADRLTPWTRAMERDVVAHFPGHVVGCYRPGTWGEHRFGRACDFMSGIAAGNEIAAYVQANAARLHVMYIIHTQHIWSPARANEGWRLMEDRGSPTANHMDHVHVSVLP
jgi:hypothetical protein